MPIKVFANARRAFSRGEVDKNGTPIRVVTNLGFNTLPDWVEKDPYFKLCVSDSSIQPYQSSAESRAIENMQEEKARLERELVELRAEKAALAGEGKDVQVKPNPIDTSEDIKTPEKSEADLKEKPPKTSEKPKKQK
jgi:hypothetical protein